MRRHLRPVVVAALAVVACCLIPPTAAETPEQVLDRMVEVYADLQTYRDRGEVITVFRTDNGSWSDAIRFSTAFARDGGSLAYPTFRGRSVEPGPKAPLFRFDFRHRAGRNGPWYDFVVWADGEDIRTWWDVHERVETHSRISEAIAYPMGVSGLSSANVPGMLFGTLSPLLNLSSVSDQGNEIIDGTACRKLQAEPYGTGERWTLWIDRETYLLRRVLILREIDSAEVVATTTYFPEVDIELAREIGRAHV